MAGYMGMGGLIYYGLRACSLVGMRLMKTTINQLVATCHMGYCRSGAGGVLLRQLSGGAGRE